MNTLEAERTPAAAAVPGRPRRSAAWIWRWLRDNYLAVGITVVLLWVVGIPLLSAVTFSFRDGSPIAPGNWTLDNYRTAYVSPQTASALGNTRVSGPGQNAAASLSAASGHAFTSGAAIA